MSVWIDFNKNESWSEVFDWHRFNGASHDAAVIRADLWEGKQKDKTFFYFYESVRQIFPNATAVQIEQLRELLDG